MNKLFNITAFTMTVLRNLFSTTLTALTGPQKTALEQINGHYLAIGEILINGKVDSAFGIAATEALVASRSTVTDAVVMGWGGGSNNQY